MINAYQIMEEDQAMFTGRSVIIASHLKGDYKRLNVYI